MLQKNANDNNKPYYVFNAKNEEGFVIISGEDEFGDIIGYSDKGTFIEEGMPENIQAWMDIYASNIANKNYQRSYIKNKASHEPIPQLVKTIWKQGDVTEQGSAYNMLCPTIDSKHCKTGCVATSMAQVMNYYQWPEEACSTIPSYFSNELVGELEALPQIDFDWQNLKNEYVGQESEEEQMAIAKLMRYCGQAAETSYNLNKSEASGNKAALALVNYFGYSPSANIIKKKEYSNRSWEEKIYLELSGSRPVIYIGSSSANTHCFICDGYDEDGLFHINWGWGGNYDGFFNLSLLNPYEIETDEGLPDGYISNVSAIIGISRYALSSDIIQFSDPQVKTICLKRWDTDGDNEISYKEAEAVISLDDVFKGDSLITEFEELRYFKNLKSIAPEAFSGCGQLYLISLPGQLNFIKERAFENCSSLQEILIPNKIEKISKDAFVGCTSLKKIKVASGNTTYNSNGNCNAIIETATNTLVTGCYTTIIPNEVEAIGPNAFEGCTQLKSIVLPPGIKTLGERCFYGCSQLQEISFSEKVTQIGSEAFAQCSGMTTIYSYNTTPPVAGENAFKDSAKMLFVPMGAKEGYQSADEWKLLHIEEMQDDYYMKSDSVAFKRDSRGMVYVNMGNKGEVLGLQLHINLPKGFSIGKVDGDFDIHMTNRSQDHTLYCTQKGENTYTILIMTMSLSPIKNNNGDIFYFSVEASDSIAADTYEIQYTDITFSIFDEMEITSIYPMPFSSKLTVKDHDMGDANHDNYVNVTDVMMIVNHILGREFDNFHSEEADLDQNGNIDVTDALRLVQIIIDQDIESPLMAPHTFMDAFLMPTAANTNTLHIDNPVPFTAMQMTVNVPAGCKIQKASLRSDRAQGHSTMLVDQGNGCYKVVIYNLNGLPFHDGDTSLLDIVTSEATTDIKVTDIVCTSSQCETIVCPDIYGTTDGITSTTFGEETATSPCYNLSGQKVNASYKGIFIQNGKKHVRK